MIVDWDLKHQHKQILLILTHNEDPDEMSHIVRGILSGSIYVVS